MEAEVTTLAADHKAKIMEEMAKHINTTFHSIETADDEKTSRSLAFDDDQVKLQLLLIFEEENFLLSKHK